MSPIAALLATISIACGAVGLVIFAVNAWRVNQTIRQLRDKNAELEERLDEAQQMIAVAAHMPKQMRASYRRQMLQYLDHYGIKVDVLVEPVASSTQIH